MVLVESSLKAQAAEIEELQSDCMSAGFVSEESFLAQAATIEMLKEALETVQNMDCGNCCRTDNHVGNYANSALNKLNNEDTGDE